MQMHREKTSMETTELIKLGLLAASVVVVAFLARRGQRVQPPAGHGADGESGDD
jgi:hypothetical protein